MEGAPIAEPQFEVLCVGRIEKPESDETGGDAATGATAPFTMTASPLAP